MPSRQDLDCQRVSITLAVACILICLPNMAFISWRLFTTFRLPRYKLNRRWLSTLKENFFTIRYCANGAW